MLVLAVVRYALAVVSALLASVGIDQLGPFGLTDLAIALLGAGLAVCQLPPVRTHAV